MQFSEETSQELTEYLEQEKYKNVCINLGIFSEKDNIGEMLKKVKEYISNDLRGNFKGDIATERFFKVINLYINNSEFTRFEGEKYIPDGFIDYNLVLPIADNEENQKKGFRISSNILGFDGNRYIVKHAEGLKGIASGRKYESDALYNPTVAYAFFRFLNQPCAINIPAYEKFPYYYIFSQNFLKDNEKMYSICDDKFMDTLLVIDENNNITHKQIMDGIVESINKKNLDNDKASELCKKVKLQYAVQETLKCLICSMDENLGNTSLVVTEDKDGKIEDINISPAYDMDLSFNLGEEVLRGLSPREVLYRTAINGKTDLSSIMHDFSELEG